jgi:hypothetical protein
MVDTVTWIPLVRNLTDPGQDVDSSPIPGDRQSVSPGAVINVEDGAICTKRRPEPHLQPVNGPAGSVGCDTGALPMAAAISSLLRRAQMSMSAVLVAPLSASLPLPSLPPQDAATSKAIHIVAILNLTTIPLATTGWNALRLDRWSTSWRESADTSQGQFARGGSVDGMELENVDWGRVAVLVVECAYDEGFPVSVRFEGSGISYAEVPMERNSAAVKTVDRCEAALNLPEFDRGDGG